jgi:VIT1/CCC1 family predicted Fe2+/Mn2+ transporter
MIPTTRHLEQHFTGSQTVGDIVIGMSDGLTVPFALAAGLSGAVAQTNLVLVAGVAEMAAGSIAMGLGGFLAARSEFEHYLAEKKREQQEVIDVPEKETEEIREIFAGYGLTGEALEAAIKAIIANSEKWVDFMMRQELGLERPDPKRALTSALTIGGAYIFGGLIPLSPYVFSITIQQALTASVILTLIALLIFGGVKARFTGVAIWRGALQTALVGGLAAGFAFLIARLVSGIGGH